MVGPWPPFKNKIKNFQETRCKKTKLDKSLAPCKNDDKKAPRHQSTKCKRHLQQRSNTLRPNWLVYVSVCTNWNPIVAEMAKTTHMFTMVYPWSCFLGRPKWFISSSVLANWNGIVCELPCFCFSPWELKGCCFKPCKNKASVYPWSKHLWFFVSQCQDGRTELAIIRRPMLVMFPLGPPPPCLFWYNSEWYIQPP